MRSPQKGLQVFLPILFFLFNPSTVSFSYAFSPQMAGSDSTSIVDSLYLSGDSLLKTGDYPQALEAFEKALSIALTEKDSHAIGKLYNGIAAAYHYQKQFKKAVRNYLKALDYINEEQDREVFVKVQSNLGAIYAQLENFEKAKNHFSHALRLIREENTLKLNVMNNLFGVYTELNEYKKAERIAKQVIALADTLDNEAFKALLYTNLSASYLQRKQWNDALVAGQKALVIRRRLNQKTPVITLNNIGYAYQKLNQPDKAISYYKKALKDAGGKGKLQVLLNLKNAARQKGDLQTALKYFEVYNHLKDSLTALNQEAQIAEITKKYEVNQKQLKIENLQTENALQKAQITQQRFWIGAVVVALFLVIGFIYVWNQRNRTRQALEKSRIQQRFLLTQLNPHFIFNALQSIQNFIFRHKTEASMKYLNSFSMLIRSVLENSDKDTVSLAEELEMIRNFLGLQQLNYNNSFTFEIKLDSLEHTENIYMPVMLIQPFVENAVIHGVKDVQEGKILIDVKKSGNMLEVTICDNGKGFDEKHVHGSNTVHRSMGREVVNKRIKEFNTTNSEAISVETRPFRQHPEFPGTKVTIHIPILNS